MLSASLAQQCFCSRVTITCCSCCGNWFCITIQRFALSHHAAASSAACAAAAAAMDTYVVYAITPSPLT